jgi:predicted N-acetyltransferase YhbS
MPPVTPPLDSPVAITPAHDLTAFDCGAMALNDYLRRHALANHRNEAARTYVAARGARVVGYYSLAAGSVVPEQAPERIKKGLARHPIPVILLARLAVDRSEHGRRLGKGLVKDAMLRAAQAADIVGCRAVLVHAKDDSAKTFYHKFDFAPSPIDDMHLYLLMKDLRKSLGWSPR